MNPRRSEKPMTTTKKTDKPRRKVIHKESTFLNVREAARDGQKVFDTFVITGKLNFANLDDQRTVNCL
jgi:archaeosine-15-forming tRNA-guanine transglycosylase